MRYTPVTLLLLFWAVMPVCAQQRDALSRRTENFLADYFQFSRLGPGYSRNMSPEAIDQFNALFADSATVCWDLFTYRSDSLQVRLTPAAYCVLAASAYRNRQPVLEYPPRRIRIRGNATRATVYLEKINLLMDGDDRPLGKNRVDLRMEIGLNREPPQILGITSEKRPQPLRSAALGLNVVAWSAAQRSITHAPAVHIGAGESYAALALPSRILYQWSALAELGPLGEGQHAPRFVTGLTWAYTPVWSVMSLYQKQYPDTITGASGQRYACTTFERAPEVSETVEFSRFEIPLQLKSYIIEGLYVKAGTVIGIITGRDAVRYQLSRTGGGTVENLQTHETVYLDRDHELDQPEFGYYRDRMYNFETTGFVRTFYIQISVACGFERRFGRLGLGFEPNLTSGMNPYTFKQISHSYPLGSQEGFRSILESTSTAGIEMAGGFRALIIWHFND